jgi:hypothetical protein
MMKNFQVFVICLFVAGLVSACSTRENVKIPQTFISKPATLVMTHLSGLEKPGYYKAGRQGLADYAISQLMTMDMREKIEEIDAGMIMEDYYYKRFGGTFESKSFKVEMVKDPIKKEHLTSFQNDDLKYAPYDFRFLKNKSAADYAIIVEPHAFGVQRPYYGFIPTGKPMGYANLSIYLVNLSDNSIVGEYRTSIEEQVHGEWDAPPDYSALVNATKNALAKALSDAYVFFSQ